MEFYTMEYAQIARSGTKSMILDIEGRSKNQNSNFFIT